MIILKNIFTKIKNNTTHFNVEDSNKRLNQFIVIVFHRRIILQSILASVHANTSLSKNRRSVCYFLGF